MVENWKLLSCSSFLFLVSVILIVMKLGEAFTVKKPMIEKKLHPVIYVPGFGGSQLEVNVLKESQHSLNCKITNLVTNYDTSTWLDWVNAFEISKTVENSIGRCWIAHMKLKYNNYTHKTDMPGVELSVPGWGDPSIVEWLIRETFAVKIFKAMVSFSGHYSKKLHSIIEQSKYFIDISNALIGLGLERNISIRSAPYDFRKTPNEHQIYFLNLKHLVEETYRKNMNTPVVLLTHSMGGPMTLHFLHQQTQEWKDKFIKSFISLSGAWGGSMKAMKVYTEGDNLGIGFFSAKTLKQVLVTTPSLAWMLPSPKFWGKDEVLATTSNRNYTLSNLKDFFHDVNQPLAWEMYKDVLNYTTDFRPPGVEVHCLHGTQGKTLEQLHYHSDFGHMPSHEWNNTGDETINLRSLEGCTRWIEMQKEKVYYKTYKGVEHTAILHDREVIEYIKSVVRGEK